MSRALKSKDAFATFAKRLFTSDVAPEEAATTKVRVDSLNELVDEDLFCKHPLENTWTFWHWQNDPSKCWNDMISEVTSFSTVEDFWSIYKIIKPPSELHKHNDYMMFKHGIRPMWEDEQNKNGGRWILIFANGSMYLDTVWQNLLLRLIGENFDNSEEICGTVVSLRQKSSKISIWTKDARNEEAIYKIGNQIKKLLPSDDEEIMYQTHRDALVHNGAIAYAIYRL